MSLRRCDGQKCTLVLWMCSGVRGFSSTQHTTLRFSADGFQQTQRISRKGCGCLLTRKKTAEKFHTIKTRLSQFSLQLFCHEDTKDFSIPMNPGVSYNYHTTKYNDRKKQKGLTVFKPNNYQCLHFIKNQIDRLHISKRTLPYYHIFCF